MFRSIRWQIAIPYVFLILVSMSGLGLYITNFIRQSYLSDLDRELGAEASLVSDLVKDYLLDNTSPELLDEIAINLSQRLDKRVTIVRQDGVVIGESHEERADMDNHIGRPEILQAQQSGSGVSTRYSHTVGDFLMYKAVSLQEDGEIIGYVRLAIPLKNIDEYISQLQRTLIGVTVLITLAAIILAIWIAGIAMQPLRHLTRAASQIASDEEHQAHLAGQVDQLAVDEIGQLTRAFNAMSIRLNNQIAALQTEQGKMAAVLSEMSDGVLIVDEQGKVKLINPAAEEMFNVHQEQALHQSMAVTLRHHQLIELWQRSKDSKETQYATLELASGKHFFQGVATPLEQALPGNTLLLFQDLTRLRRLETVRQDFISNISHELRTPLASLKALTETLQESALEDPPAARRFLNQMDIEVDALSMMVSELLELSRIESGRVPLKLKAASAREMIEQAVERLNMQAQRAGIQVEIDVAPDCPEALVDPSRLEQVLVNILHNAIKYTAQGGKIQISARQKAEHILFSVQDNGVGIPEGDLLRIFERFYKTDRARSGIGTGLGLAISKHLVEAHKGKIWAESVEGQGSTFFFTVPLA
ncbi:MAG TPA: ATP-binding protein [Anaerolineales bacterium]|nr:ATP-binding protein [Anaerolineales bacterium]